MLDGKKMIIIIFGGLYNFMSTSIKFELLIIQNKTSSPEDFKFTRFDCNYCFKRDCMNNKVTDQTAQTCRLICTFPILLNETLPRSCTKYVFMKN